ncbi:Glutamate carboxypeptidase [Lentibacillus sp. JNUCC-1]|uniref:M20 family metallopeptidase n=1 Tax=Lentibacillus sp. JNUCC-1 TaxID=2654513 RepID=UPI0012E7FBFC|nr:M20 family metallopeptidase [Lentibacillus sp. JNUCC-1]MUV37023.1 Glutamate carboxypeptidase [Lentibacillus sp. JNUCC-1]
MKQQVLDYIDQNRDEMLALWEELVNVESAKDQIPGIDSLISKVEAILQNEGFHTRIIHYEKTGNAVVAEFGDVETKKPIIFIGHVDTVFPKGFLHDHPFQIRDGKAYGPGILDMKGGVASILYAVKALRAAQFSNYPLKVIIVGDEEDAHTNSDAKSMILEEARNGAYAFNTETGNLDNSLSIGRAGGAIYELEVRGVASHTGIDWKKGRNAIIELSHKMIAIDSESNHDAGYTYNVTITEGGTAPNTCPDYAKATIGTRCQTAAQQDMMHHTLKKISEKQFIDGTETSLTYIGGFDPMEATDGNRRLFEAIRTTAEELQMEEPHAVTSQGSSDSAYTTLAGVPTVCSLGPVGEGNHTPHEYAVVESLFERCKLLAVSVLNV